jgi:DNA-binding NtrC family response regulator
MKILIVEDEHIIAMDMAAILREAGDHEVRLAPSVAKALNLLRQESFDAAMLDMNLRGETSTPVAEACTGAGIPFLILSGYNSAQIAKDFNGVPVLAKPCRPAALVSAVERLCGGR